MIQASSIAVQVLQGIAQEYINEAKDFAAPRVAPIVESRTQEGTYHRFGPLNFLGAGDAETLISAPLSRVPARRRMTMTTAAYRCERYRQETEEDKDTLANIEATTGVVGWQAKMAQAVTQDLLIAWEERVHQAFTAANFSQAITPAVAWDNTAGVPLDDLVLGLHRIKRNSGYLPDTLVLAPPVFFALKDNPQVRGLVGDGESTLPINKVRSVLSEYLSLRNDGMMLDVFVASASWNTANDLGPAFSGGYVWDEVGTTVASAVLMKRGAGGSLLDPGALASIAWKGSGSGIGVPTFEVYEEKDRKALVVDGTHWVDEFVTGAELAVPYLNVLT